MSEHDDGADDFGGLEAIDAVLDPEPLSDDDIDPAQVIEGSKQRLNDIGNAHRMVIYFGDDLLFVPRVGWFTWTGKVWAKDPDEIRVSRLSQRLCEMIELERWQLSLSNSQMELISSESELLDRLGLLRRETDDRGEPLEPGKIREIEAQLSAIGRVKKRLSDMRAEHKRHAKSSGNKSRMEAARVEASFMLARDLEDLDREPLDLNTEGSVLRFKVQVEDGFRRSEVIEMPHDRAALMTKLMAVTYDTVAECPDFDRFFERIQPDETMRRFLLRWFALSMTGLIEQKLAFFYGGGANGKSVLVDIFARIAGAYAATAKIESLTGANRRGGGEATPDLVPLIGARLVRANEPDEGVRWQEGLIKELTGGDPILVRALQKDFVEVRPFFTLTINGNHKPEIRGTDDGIWRRLLLVPFDVQIPEGERLPKAELDAMLWAERDGIFSRHIVPALLEYLEIGLAEPQSVLDATAEFRADSDMFGAFLTDVCLVTGDPEHSIKSLELMRAFQFWQMRGGLTPFKDTTITRQLKDRSRRWRSPDGRQFNSRKSGGNMHYDGIRFTDLFRRDFDLAPRDSQGRILNPTGTISSSAAEDDD
ncbi:phage/plasmid primase, P4 family [Pararhodobacter sp. CCB-MM2]|uniref:DNA primase family protein n=1 Tax=Pararhodobacter sp. CCB-MM2 TaxID=1786003 RepID=UPI0008326088|nr:phage/plasmid primase, P4 family [Pararhodobacter sp. CCB-MM2]